MRVALDEHEVPEALLEAHLTRGEHREPVRHRERRSARVETDEQVRRVAPRELPHCGAVATHELEYNQRAIGGRRNVSGTESRQETRTQGARERVYESAQERLAAAAPFNQLRRLRADMYLYSFFRKVARWCLFD